MNYRIFLVSSLLVTFHLHLFADDKNIFPHAVENYDNRVPLSALVNSIESEPYEKAVSMLIHLDEASNGRETILIWWKDQRSDLRRFAIFLMAKSVTDAVVGDALRNDLLEAANRFADVEKEARIEEINWVWGRLPKLILEWKNVRVDRTREQ